MLLKKILITVLLPLIAFAANPYDTSTPKKFVISMGLISQQGPKENPLPHFYEPASAEAILAFDQSSENAMRSFDKFRNTLNVKFPNHVIENKARGLEIALDAYSEMSTIRFTFSATFIGAQLKERKPSDYEFVSATKPDTEGVVQVTLKISGKTSTLPIKNTAQGYRMFLTQDVLDKIAATIKQVAKLEKVFSDATQEIENGVITEENFEEKLEQVYFNYQEAI